MKNPFFSVIIPTYNRQKFLKIAVQSVLQQTFQDYELIIVDDGSIDKTKQIIAEFGSKKIKYVCQNHRGVSSARNNGLNRAKGNYIAFLDSDDRFCREKLEITYDCIAKNPRYKVFHTEEIWYRNGRLLSEKKYHKKPRGLVFSNSLKLCCISPSAAVIDKDIFRELGGFDEKLPACEDYDFWLRVTSKYPIFLIPQCLTIKEGGHPDQQSKKYPGAMDKFRIYALEKLLKSNKLKAEYYELAFQELHNKCSIYIKGALKRQKRSEVRYYKNLLLELRKSKFYVK